VVVDTAVDEIESSPESSYDDDYRDKSDDRMVNRPISLSMQREIDTLMHCIVKLGASVRSASLSSHTSKADTNFDRRHHKELQEHLRLVLLSYSAYENEDPSNTSTEAAIQDVLDRELRPAQAHVIEANLRRRHRYIWAGRRADSFKSSNAREASTTSTGPQAEPAVSVSVAKSTGSNVSTQYNANQTRGRQTPISVSTIQTSQLRAI